MMGTANSNWGRWGPDDQTGALNELSPDHVLDAIATVRTGRVIPLAQPLGQGTVVPAYRDRPRLFVTRGAGDYPAGTRPPERFLFAEDVLQFPSHSGTHLDALAHCWAEDSLYNGHASTTLRSDGARRLGAEHLTPVVGRGVLLDVAQTMGGSLGKSVAVDEVVLQRCAAESGVAIAPGDTVLIRTGWWTTQRDTLSYYEGEPGITLRGAQWLAEQGAIIVGADNYAVEVQPSGEASTGPVHLLLIHQLGIPLLENLDLDELAQAGRTEFLLILAPIRFARSTGGPLTPLAVL